MASKKRRILVTGVARWWGALVVQRLVDDPDVAEVIGIDTREPRYDLGRADYLKLDIRHSLIGKLVRSVGHRHRRAHADPRRFLRHGSAPRPRDERHRHAQPARGLRRATGSPVTRFVLKSSGHVYGSRVDLPTGLREDHRLDSNSRHQFVRDIVEVESYVTDFAARNPGIAHPGASFREQPERRRATAPGAGTWTSRWCRPSRATTRRFSSRIETTASRR